MSGGGLAGSVDGGVTWGILPPLADAGSVRLLTADTKEPGRLYALLENEGATSLLEGSPEESEWHHLAAEGTMAFSQDMATGDLYIINKDGVQISTDRGTLFAPLPGSPQEGVALTVIPGPTDLPPTVLVGTGSGLFATSDGGATWEEIT